MSCLETFVGADLALALPLEVDVVGRVAVEASGGCVHVMASDSSSGTGVIVYTSGGVASGLDLDSGAADIDS